MPAPPPAQSGPRRPAAPPQRPAQAVTVLEEVLEARPAARDEAPAGPRHRPPADRDRGDRGEDDLVLAAAKRRAAQGRGFPLALVQGLVGGGVLLMVGVGLAAYFLFFQKTQIDPSDWSDFIPRDGGCRIAMPGKPAAGPLPGEPGLLNAQSHQVALRSPRVTFTLAFYDLGDEAAKVPWEQRCTDEINRVLGETGGQLVYQTRVVVNGHGGRDFFVQTPGGEGVVERLVRYQGLPDRVYCVSVRGPGIRPEADPAAHFLRSFWMLGRAEAPPGF
jgi:hypothetical protein